MRLQLHRVVAFALAIFCAGIAHADQVDDFVRQELQKQRIPGAAVAVLQNGKVVKIAGYGVSDRARNTPVTPETVFKIGSVSKQFIATGIMLLVEDGRLRLEDPISTYIPGTPATWSGITIRHLLTHSSGIIREGPAFDPFKVQPDIDVIRSAYDVPLRFAPGDRWEYGNVNYFALADIIRVVTGRPWSEFIAARVFKPSGMTATRTTTTTETVPNRARGYSDNDRLIDAEDWPAVRPSGAFFSTVADLAKWEAVLGTNAVLNESTRRLMWTPVRLNDGTTHPYGFGWELDPYRGFARVHHGGGLPGFISEFARFPEHGLTVIVLINLDDADVQGLSEGIASLYLPAPASAR